MARIRIHHPATGHWFPWLILLGTLMVMGGILASACGAAQTSAEPESWVFLR